ncbi:hypothetical protein [Albibacterium indicum]|uniref:hypothetical protein n=1 Tax=Albibacterium indicum TaxID=2292082 RepID=UPI000E486046|nr:hypothetical protein [Pedobacter indicus]
MSKVLFQRPSYAFGVDILEWPYEYVHTEGTDRPPWEHVKAVIEKLTIEISSSPSLTFVLLDGERKMKYYRTDFGFFEGKCG